MKKSVYSICGMCTVRCPIRVESENNQITWIEGNQQIGLSFYYTNLGEAPLNNSIVSGKYTTNHGFFFNVNINWRKLPWSGKLSI